MNLSQRASTEVTRSGSTIERRKAFTGAHSPVSDAEARRRRPGTGVACLILLGITVGALGHVAVHLKHYEVALALGEARRTRGILEERKRQLSLEIGVYKDPTRVMDVAREKLGLSQPSAADIVPAAQLRERMAMRLANSEAKPTAAPAPAKTTAASPVAAPEQADVEESLPSVDDEGEEP